MDITTYVCRAEKCYRGVVARGLCDTHYRVEFRQERPLYTTWLNIKQKCYNKTNISYRFYGARGIKVCERWRKNYHAFIADMGERPPGMVLDRIDGDGDFNPFNCVWAPRKQVYARTVTGARYNS